MIKKTTLLFGSLILFNSCYAGNFFEDTNIECLPTSELIPDRIEYHTYISALIGTVVNELLKTYFNSPQYSAYIYPYINGYSIIDNAPLPGAMKTTTGRFILKEGLEIGLVGVGINKYLKTIYITNGTKQIYLAMYNNIKTEHPDWTEAQITHTVNEFMEQKSDEINQALEAHIESDRFTKDWQHQFCSYLGHHWGGMLGSHALSSIMDREDWKNTRFLPPLYDTSIHQYTTQLASIVLQLTETPVLTRLSNHHIKGSKIALELVRNRTTGKAEGQVRVETTLHHSNVLKVQGNVSLQTSSLTPRYGFYFSAGI